MAETYHAVGVSEIPVLYAVEDAEVDADVVKVKMIDGSDQAGGALSTVPFQQ